MKPWTCFYCGLVTEGTFHSCTHATLDPEDEPDEEGDVGRNS